jgi:hypothetical protein
MFKPCETRANEHPDSPNSILWREKTTREKSILKPHWSAKFITLFKYFVILKWKKVEHVKEVIFTDFTGLNWGMFKACDAWAKENLCTKNPTLMMRKENWSKMNFKVTLIRQIDNSVQILGLSSVHQKWKKMFKNVIIKNEQILQVRIKECLKPVRLVKMATSHPKSKPIMREKKLEEKAFWSPTKQPDWQHFSNILVVVHASILKRTLTFKKVFFYWFYRFELGNV